MIAINNYIDAAILKPEFTVQEVAAAIQDCITWNTKTVCVRPCDIGLAKKLTAGTDTGVSCVLAFPHGSVPSSVKICEAEDYIAQGADEIDMVANIGMIRSGEWDYVARDISAVTKICKSSGIILKVILEVFFLTPEEIVRATKVCAGCGADFVKTSTGFAGGGATEKAVQLMLDAADGHIRVKASGGIKTQKEAFSFIEMGVERLGIGFASNRAVIQGQPESDNQSETY
ncbi:deoxyribose-phosphate aldolase [Brucepastera parasyntrophica]|uniref:deoxyribose-phosphate aldolase n=1 Tax=Brucepastera parasyntrophica TaxID=2880008 RepID=UPI0021091E11|nr:deoxyribose-phosphate aldolase [Brucepastera parasyntrophica]ULQ59393.1 deoxyribose-phosphate aldolase [Brucepastera parasyntrophica]